MQCDVCAHQEWVKPQKFCDYVSCTEEKCVADCYPSELQDWWSDMICSECSREKHKCRSCENPLVKCLQCDDFVLFSSGGGRDRCYDCIPDFFCDFEKLLTDEKVALLPSDLVPFVLAFLYRL